MNRAGLPRRSRPRRALETLEPRTLMAVFTVTSTADILAPPAGTVTLRSAIQAANTTPGPNTINLPLAGLYKITSLIGATNNSAGELAIADSGDLTIRNASGGGVTVDGGGLYRVLDVDPAGSVVPFTVTFAGLVITGGVSTLGGGAGIDIHGAASVVLNGCAVDGNVTTNSGGGIATEPNSTGMLVLNGTRVSGNRAYGGGGGIAALGTGALSIGPGSLIDENAQLGGAGGGGILLNGAPMGMVGAVLRNNRAFAGGGVDNGGNGAVSIVGSLFEDNSTQANGGGYADTGLASLTIRDSFFLNNTASGNGGGLAAGGSLITVINTTVAGNASLSGSISGGGGGVFIYGTGTTRLIDSAILGNMAIISGGGILDGQAAKLVLTGSTVADNRAVVVGGGGLSATLAAIGDVSVSTTVFRGNSTGAAGGALDVRGGTLEVANSRVKANAAHDAGAMNLVGTAFRVDGCTIDGNRSLGNGGGILTNSTGPGSLIVNSTVTGNMAGAAFGGVEILGNAAGVVGLVSDTIDGNSGGLAGGVYLNLPTLYVEDTIIAGNTSGGSANDFNYAAGTVNDMGGNLLGTLAGAGGKFGAATIVADPKLGPLEDNGGQPAGAPFDAGIIPTQALLPGSPAFGKGVAAGAPTADERGFARRSPPSIGAYEPLYSNTAPANAVFVEDLYETLLGRPGDPAGLLAGFNFLNGGGTPTALTQVFQASNEFLGREASRIVRRYLDRTPSPAEVSNVVAFLASGHTPEQAASIFINSGEFAQDYGNSQDVYLESMYQTTLGRAAAPAEVAGWGQALGAGLTRPKLVNLFLSSEAYLTDLIVDAFAAYLGRPATPQDTAAFLNAARSGVSSLALRAILLGNSFATRA